MNVVWKSEKFSCEFVFSNCDPSQLGQPGNECKCALLLSGDKEDNKTVVSTVIKDYHDKFVKAFQRMM